jgi:hypothetical protein
MWPVSARVVLTASRKSAWANSPNPRGAIWFFEIISGYDKASALILIWARLVQSLFYSTGKSFTRARPAAEVIKEGRFEIALLLRRRLQTAVPCDESGDRCD